MIRELSSKNQQIGFNNQISRGNLRSPTNKIITPINKPRGQLNINIPKYLVEKNNLNKSNDFTNINTIDRKSPMNSSGNRLKTTTAKEKKYTDKILSNKYEGNIFTSLDNERTLDTTNPTKQTINKNLSQNIYNSSIIILAVVT